MTDRNEALVNPADSDATRSGRTFGGHNSYPPYRSKLDDILRDEHRAEYEQMIVRGTTVRRLWQWLLDRDYDIGRNAVDGHRTKFLVAFGQVRTGARVAEEFAQVARAAGLTLTEASIGGMHQMLMQFFARQQKQDTLTASDVRALSAAVAGFIDSHGKVETIKRELSSAPKEGASVGADHAAVVARVRDILGVNLK